MLSEPSFKRAGWITLGACGPLTWMLSASLVWSSGTRTPYTPLAWWHATKWWGVNSWCKLWLIAGAAAPSILALLLLFAWWQSRRTQGPPRHLTTSRGAIKTKPLPIQRGITDNHGHSEWRSMESARKRFPGPKFPHGGIVVGEAYRVDHDDAVRGIEFDPWDKSTWGFGGKADLLIDPCTKGARAWHSAEFGPTGTGKSAELVTKILAWTGSSVVFDPTIELGPKLDRALRRQRKRVYQIGLSDPTKPITMTGFNVLAGFDVDHPDAELHVLSLVARIYDEEGAASNMARHGYASDPYWDKMGRILVGCLLAHLLWQDPQPERVEISLSTLADGMATPETDMIALLHKIRATSPSLMARRNAGSLMQARAEQTFSSIYLNAVGGVNWLFASRYADLLSIGTFDPLALLNGNCTAFINIDLRALEIARTVPRVIIGGILDVIFAAEGHVNGLIALFIDEMDTLKRLHALETLRDRGRHYKAILHGLWQSPFQLRTTWGEDGFRSWMDQFSWVGFSGVRALGYGKELSEGLGGHGVMAYSEGDNQGQQMPLGLSFGTFSRGQNVSTHEISHHLMTAAQLQQDLSQAEKIIVPDVGMPLRIGRALYFRRPDICARLER